ncbi:SUMO1 sentrin specific peptidase 8 [Homalodisca vitripennis]|nr:SUMO1 sentrin specific peptidase 8 [Homalodisca vitripennis]
MLHEEKCLRQTELNDSFNVQELLNDEKETLVVNNNLLTSSLSKLGSKFKDEANELMSLRLELKNKDAVINEISKDLKTCTLEKTNFTSTVENLKAQLKEAENKAWSTSRWLDDKVLDSYFDAFKIDDELSFRKTLGSDDVVGVLLKDLSFTSADFAFCCVGDNEAVLADDAGSHWSLLFIDIKANVSYHLDSLSPYNYENARKVSENLSFREGSVVEIGCPRQKNAFECGLNVLVNTRIINQSFCKGAASDDTAFPEWFSCFNRKKHKHGDDNASILEVQEKHVSLKGAVSLFPDENLNNDFSIVNNREWKTVKTKQRRKKVAMNHSRIHCKNRYDILSTVETDEIIIKNVSGTWKQKPVHCTKKISPSKHVNCRLAVNKSSNCVKIKCKNKNRIVSSSAISESEMSNNKDTLTEATVGLTFRYAGSGVAGGLESGGVGPLGGVLLIGDSMLKYSVRGCVLAGAEVDVNPGARIHNIKEKLIRTYVNNQPKVVFINVGTNDLCKNYNGGEGYNGGWGKRAVLHTMADLLNVARHSFPNSLIMLSGVLLRNDISALAIANFNQQLALMCNNFGVLFVDANLWLLRRHLARDGRHLNRIGNGHFDVFILNRVREVLDVCEMPGGGGFHESDVVAKSPVEPTVSHSGSEGSAKRPENWGDGDRRSHG